MSVRIVVSFLIGGLVRVALFYSGWSPVFQRRVEVSTPLNSWVNVEEGLYLRRKGLSPYEGDTFHETPLLLAGAEQLTHLPVSILQALFILTDLLTAICLAAFAREAKTFYLRRSEERSEHVNESKDLSISGKEDSGELVLMAYLLSPFSIFSSVAMTTTVFTNLATALAILTMLKGWRVIACVCLALAVSESLYPISLLLPLLLSVHQKEVETSRGHKGSFLRSAAVSGIVFGLSLGLIFYSSYLLSDGLLFFTRIYGFILGVPDLRPNLGLFWYFFTEMFEHFHLLFLWTFQINAFIYLIPLAIRFSDQPPLLIHTFLAIGAIFKSYPSVGDLALYLALLPIWKHLGPFMQQKFIVACFFIATTILAPVQWYLWIYSGSANANFYFGVTIALGTAEIFLLTDVLLSYLKREYYLENGMKKEIDGKPARLALH